MDVKTYPEDIISNNFNEVISQIKKEDTVTRFIQIIPEGIIEKMAKKRELGPAFYKIKKIVKEYESFSKQMCPNENIPQLILKQAKYLRENPQFTQSVDEKYGQGMYEFFVQAVEAYYQS